MNLGSVQDPAFKLGMVACNASTLEANLSYIVRPYLQKKKKKKNILLCHWVGSIYPEEQLLGQIVILYLIFWRIATLFFRFSILTLS
jgi:hypothetical protein